MRPLPTARTSLIALAALGVLLIGCTAGSTSTGSGPSTATSPAATSASPTASETGLGYTVLPTVDGAVPLVAGRYGLAPTGPDAGPVAVVDIPDGYVASDNLLFPAVEETGQADECCVVGYWTVARVYLDPCEQRAPRDPGPGVQDLADALVAQRTTSTEPHPVTVGGYDGLYLELTAPPGLGDLSACKDKALVYWLSDPGDRWFDASHYDPSEGLPLERVWILDVDGRRVVLSAGVESGVADEQAQPLVDIVESARFVQT